MFRSVAEIDEALHRLGRRLLYADAPTVARDLGLSPGWLNTAAGEVLDVYGPPDGLAERLVMRDYGPTLRAGFL